MKNATLIHGDCLEKMRDIPSGSIDMVLADPPYGMTACKWDSIIPLEPMWKQLERLIKRTGAIVMTASQPFTSTLIASNMAMFKYCWVWEKEQGSMPMNAPFQPIKAHEDIVVFSHAASTFSKKGNIAYYPVMRNGVPYKGAQHKGGQYQYHTSPKEHTFKDNAGTRYPRSVIQFTTERGLHPTQKPVALMGYLIRTYTNEGETVLDFCMGSGTTGVAALKLGRKFIGIELKEEYVRLAEKRIGRAMPLFANADLGWRGSDGRER